MLAKRVEDSIELWKAREAGGAVMPAEMECSGYGAVIAVSLMGRERLMCSK